MFEQLRARIHRLARVRQVRRRATAILSTLALAVIGAAAGGTASADPSEAESSSDVAALANGPELSWLTRYDAGVSSFDTDIGRGVVISPDGSRVYVTGESGGSQTRNLDYATLAYDADTGEQLWESRYDGPFGGAADLAADIAVSPDGGTVIITGRSQGVGTNTDYATIAYDADTGAELWVARYNGPGNDRDLPCPVAEFECLVVTDDMVFVTGNTIVDPTAQVNWGDYATVAYSLDTGEELWVAHYDGPTNSNDSANAIDVSPDGNTIVVTGNSPSVDTATDYATVAYNADTGDELWVARYNGPGNLSDNANAVVISPDGERVFVSGLDRNENCRFSTDQNCMDLATVAYGMDTGEQLWVARYNGPGDGSDNNRGIAVSADGGTVVIAGYSDGGDSFWDYATIAYDAATGAQSWVSRYNGPGNALDVAYAMTVEGDQVFVTGESLLTPAAPPIPAGNPSYTTISYDLATGEELWAEIFDHAGHDDKAMAIEAVEDELGFTVLVTGRSFDFTTRTDYLTISYRDEPPPVVTVSPPQIEATQGPAEETKHTLTIGNEGEGVLGWDVFADQPGSLRVPLGDVTEVATTSPPDLSDSGDATLSTNKSSVERAGVAALPNAAPQDDVAALTHSESQEILAGNSVACVGPGGTRQGSYLRTFTLQDFGIFSGFSVADVSFGIENLTAARPVTVNLYTLDDEPFTYANMTQIGTTTAELDAQSLSLVTVPVTGFAPAGSTVVAEVAAPDMTLLGGFFIGSNNAGQTAPSYLRSTPCNIPEPTDTALLGEPGMHIVMNVSGFPIEPPE